MNILKSFIYGIVYGLSEFLPISTYAHKRILSDLFGITVGDPLQSILVHIALILAVFTGCRNSIDKLRKGQLSLRRNRRGSRGSSNVSELLFLRNAVIPMLLLSFILYRCVKLSNSILWLTLFSLINGILLIVQSRLMQGHKDEKSMSFFDSVFIGASAAFSAFPGISRITAMLTASTIRGIDRQKAMDWIILLSVPALLFNIFMDISAIFSSPTTVNISANIFNYVFSTAGAYVSGYLGILFIKSHSANSDHSSFAFYSLGVALFTVFMYLTIA